MNEAKILEYVKAQKASFERGGVSSNEIRFFSYENKKYVLKTPLMVGENMGPFWCMMKNIFDFTFKKQISHLEQIYNVLKQNPHIKMVPFVAADETAMIYEFVKGDSWDEDDFSNVEDNAYRLGQYIGYNHSLKHENCGILSVEKITEIYAVMMKHMESYIQQYWNSDSTVDTQVRDLFMKIKTIPFYSDGYALTMIDICGDQFLYKNEKIVACVDMDAYVVGPIEWELSFLKLQVKDWESFRKGYETYQPLPAFEKISPLYIFLMTINSVYNKAEVEEYWLPIIRSEFPTSLAAMYSKRR